MSPRAANRPADPAERVLTLAPTGHDAAMICERLRARQIACETCATLEELLAGMRAGAGALLVAKEALSPAGVRALVDALEAQEPWSDIPLLLLVEAESAVARGRPGGQVLFHANVVLLERPLPVPMLVSAVTAALRARRRQYQMRDQHQELERAVQLGRLLMSILGHDLRTPLGAIRLSAEHILRVAREDRVLRPAGRILAASDRMTRLISQLLDYERLRQGQEIPMTLRPVDLGDTCAPVVAELEDSRPGARIEVAEIGDLAGSWDPDRIAQIVSNLVANAVEHGAPEEPVTVTLDGSAEDAVTVRVRNGGVIPAEALPVLFEPFRRVSPARGTGGPPRRRGEGLGLGLYIAREFARAHGGDIGVRSGEPEGTVFTVTLPRHASVRPEEHPEDPAHPQQPR